MFTKKLPKGGNDFTMIGRSGFQRKLNDLTRYGQFSNLKNNRKEAIIIFENLVPTIRRDGKIPLSARLRSSRKFAKSPGVTKQDIRDFKKILDYYK